ncbi:Bug family tripartite tricarboxylate transporter substrate binding protein [Piscinibacter gummiphilus]|uniref:Tripartite tricarboxylate transporter substrate-binding protein n=1 Tax=Piscinibacter gummiphilus TaxID=946333 RepID=A0ABZ0D0J2_9BURK|nr:tripartite tricarboxylate transporter substrate-binding protein [Piscinibacter gummiphilus]WOB08578.1 tripartite tricarboxylate transporter substrate-binding protein [Piscinibacter gummiphilus]
MISKRHLLAAAAAAALAALLPLTPAMAQTAAWPTKPVRLVVGFPGGSSPDVMARTLSDALSKALGQPVVVDNRPGASGNIAADQVAKATDEHTLGIVINGNLTVARLINPATPFDPARDFAPISLLGTAPLVLTAAGDAKGSTPAELIAWAKSLGDKGNYGTPGNGTVGHLGMELLKSKTGIGAMHVPFPGNPQVVTALIAGQVQLSLLPPGIAMPQVKAGKLKAVAVTSPTRSALVPDVPTLREAGVNGTDLEVWTALVGPASLPKPVVARVAAAVAEVMKQPDTQARLLTAGWQAVGSAPEGLAQRMKADTAQLSDIITSRNIKSD